MEKENKGFTLLEVLVAVVILALIAVPLLRSFVSAYHVNARSRETMRATTLAQNEMEIFEREKLDVLLKYAKAKDGTGGSGDADTGGAVDSAEKERLERYGDYEYSKESHSTTADDGKTQEHFKYTFSKTGVINDESGRDDFDVYVTLDSAEYSDELPADPDTLSSIESANNEQLLFMNTLSGADSASYVQRVNQMAADGSVVRAGEDEEVYEMYVNRQDPESYGSRFNAMQFASLLNRTITLTIEQMDKGGQKITVAKVNYAYELANPSVGYESTDDIDALTKKDWFDSIPEQSRQYTSGDKVIFNNAQNLDEDGKPVELKNVYLFYAPMAYDWGSSTGHPFVRNDRIVVKNEDNLPVNIYLIRQNLCTASGNKVGIYSNRDDDGVEVAPPTVTLSDKYKVDIDVVEGIIGDDETAAEITAQTGRVKKKGQTYGSYFTNLNLNPDDSEGTTPGTMNPDDSEGTTPGTIELRLKDAANGLPVGASDKEIMEDLGLQTLDATQAKDRIYTMTVRVYRSGSDADGDGQPDADTEPLVEDKC